MWPAGLRLRAGPLSGSTVVGPARLGGQGAGELGGSSQRTRWHGYACQPVVQGRSLSVVSICPDVLNPVAARNVERVHRHGDAVQLNHQTGLTVDLTFQDRHAGHRTCPIDEKACDLLGAFDRAEPTLTRPPPSPVAWRRGRGSQ